MTYNYYYIIGYYDMEINISKVYKLIYFLNINDTYQIITILNFL